ncbi:MAG: universal stress protein [Methanosarcinaceae archaeon]|nr:universal stress protein [Methanosarcinaceae archaeon]MDD4331331.1 universal stress protein [Methanosarcinaceae archaeon]MDD4749089.1 universal stress protein [Methanosarcinaceae archaeon]
MGSPIFRKIMIATDGSENTNASVKAGIEISRLSGAKVYAVYVVSTDYYSSMAVDFGWETMYEVLKKEGEEALAFVKAAGEVAGVRVESLLLEGHPAPELIDFAEREKMDLVVMGTLGRTGLDRLLLGSVAGNVVRHCKVPVMVVREGKIEKTKPDS